MNQAYNALMAEARRLKGACDALIEEKRRLRALNAKLVTACEETVRMLGADCHLYKAGEKAKAALAEAREPQQPPQGLPSGTA